MAKFTVTHEFDCDVETFWKIFFDKTFNDQLYKRELGFTEYRVLEERETDRETTRKVFARPKVDLPGPLAKMFGDLSFTEEGALDKTTRVWRFKNIPGSMPDKVKTDGTMRVESIGANRVRRVADINVEAKVFGLGGMIESTAEKELRKGWNKSAEFIAQWIREGKAK